MLFLYKFLFTYKMSSYFIKTTIIHKVVAYSFVPLKYTECEKTSNLIKSNDSGVRLR